MNNRWKDLTDDEVDMLICSLVDFEYRIENDSTFSRKQRRAHETLMNELLDEGIRREYVGYQG